MRKLMAAICAGCICIMAGGILGGYWMGHKYCSRLMDSKKLADKHLHMVRLYDIWMMTKQNGASFEQFLLDKGIHTIAIYGMSYMGIRLFHELEHGNVHIAYGMDQEVKAEIPRLKIYKPDEASKDGIDAVIVTAIFAFDIIKKNLEQLGFGKIISLDEIIYNLI